MSNLSINRYAVFGNPIKHSLSPKIHYLFAKEMKIDLEYIAHHVFKENLEDVLSNFFKGLGKGANITLPFKKKAFVYANVLTDQAKISGSVNTLKKLNNNLILGDNTDGVGLIYDLKRLNFIKKNSKILLLGAGGSAYAIVPSLLFFGCKVFILNRTMCYAKAMIFKFEKIGKIYFAESNFLKKYFFDLIINATSSGIYNQVPQIPYELVSANTCFYDLYYQSNLTPFLQWCKYYGGIYLSDGLGMLVSQAAHSFSLWHSKFPNVERVIRILKKN